MRAYQSNQIQQDWEDGLSVQEIAAKRGFSSSYVTTVIALIEERDTLEEEAEANASEP